MRRFRRWLQRHNVVALGPLYFTYAENKLTLIRDEHVITVPAKNVPWITKTFTNEIEWPWRTGKGIGFRLGFQDSASLVIGFWTKHEERTEEDGLLKAIYGTWKELTPDEARPELPVKENQ